MVNNGNLPNTVEMENAGVYKIAFTPEQAGKQYVDINFNREPLPGMFLKKTIVNFIAISIIINFPFLRLCCDNAYD